MSKTLTTEDILHIAKLANLTLTDEEIEKFRSQLSETITYVENLNELDTSTVSTAAQLTVEVNTYFEDGKENKRVLSQEDALANAKAHNKKYFVVKRIMHE